MTKSAPPLHLYLRSFVGLFLRDLRVLRRELIAFIVRVVMQPLLFLFVFTYIFPKMGQGNPMGAGGGSSFGTVVLPGLMAVAVMFTGIAATALPLSTEFGITREIDDRVMCPMPLAGIAVEKVVFSAMQSMLAALLVLPMAWLVPSTPIHAHIQNWAFTLFILLLSSLVSGSMGLAIGSYIKPGQIGLVFSIFLVPITFLGCVYYPWAYLDKMPVLQYLILVNPIVYMSEGLRAAVTPSLPHMPLAGITVALIAWMFLLGGIGLRGFFRRVVS